MVKAKTILNRTKKQTQKFEPKTPIATEMFLPNQSGDHSAGNVRMTPVSDIDIANKKYVDDNEFSGDHGDLTNVTANQHHTPTASGDIDHNATVNTHNLTTDIDHDTITNTHDLTTNIDHNSITNTHNLTSDISHDSIADVSVDDHHAQVHTIVSHDITATGAEIDTHLALTNEHIDWTNASDNLTTTGTGAFGDESKIEGAQPDLIINWTNTAQFGRVIFKENGTDIGVFQAIGSTFSTASRRGDLEFYATAAGNDITFFTGGTQRMAVKDTGEIGIGTDSPSAGYKVHVHNPSGLNTAKFTGTGSWPKVTLLAGTTGGAYLIKTAADGNGLEFAFNDATNDGYLQIFGNNEFYIYTNGQQRLFILGDGKMGVGTSPTTQFSVKEKSGMSPIGGFMIKLTNKTGANSIAGYCVTNSDSTADAVRLVPINEPNCIGVFLESGVSDGSEAWIVVAGIADVYFWATTTLGHMARTGLTADTGEVSGQAFSEASPTSPFSVDKHFCEVGHVLEAREGAGLARCVLHNN